MTTTTTTTTTSTTRTYAGGLTATWGEKTGLWTVTRDGVVLGTVSEEDDAYPVHPAGWPHPFGSCTRQTLAAAVRALREQADKPLSAPTSQAQASRLASRLVRELGRSPRTDYRGEVLSTRIEINPNCTQWMKDVLAACPLVASAVVVPGQRGSRMFVTWHAPASS